MLLFGSRISLCAHEMCTELLIFAALEMSGRCQGGRREVEVLGRDPQQPARGAAGVGRYAIDVRRRQTSE